MIPGVCAWIFVVLRTKPKVSVSFAKVSFRSGSSPGSSTSLTRGMRRLYPRVPSPPSSARSIEPVLDAGQGVEDHLADDLETLRGDLVEGVLGRVPRRKVEVD